MHCLTVQTFVFLFAFFKGHTESVTCVCFSHDDKYLATSDLAGLVQVWQCSTGKCVWKFNASSGEIEVS